MLRRDTLLQSGLLNVLVLAMLTPPSKGFSDGAPPPPPTWQVPQIESPLWIPQEGVLTFQATLNTIQGLHSEEAPTFTLSVSDAEGQEIAGESSYLELTPYGPHMLMWRASEPLEPGSELSMSVTLVHHSESEQAPYEDEIALRVFESDTPALMGVEVNAHTPDLSRRPLGNHTCYAPNVRVDWAPPAGLPEWMHRFLVYELGLMHTDGTLSSTEAFTAFSNPRVFKVFASTPEDLSDTYCVSLTTRSLIDDAVVIEESCLEVEDFEAALGEGQVLCTLDTYMDYAETESPDGATDSLSAEDAPDDGGCHGRSGPLIPCAALSVALMALLSRRRCAGVG